MSKLVWDKVGERFYETGVRNGALYVQDAKTGAYQTGVAWNGLISVSESPSGGESNPLYADDIKYLDLVSVEELGGTIEAYTYPEEFGVCDGSAEITPGVIAGQQGRQAFGLVYRTTLGNDTEYDGYGYKLHLIYGAKVTPSERGYSTISDSPEAITFSWEYTTTPVEVPGDGNRPTSLLTIDSTKVDEAKMKAFEAMLFGSDGGEGGAPTLPLPEEVIAHFAE